MEKKALAIGIDKYPANPLHACVRDATAIATLLQTNGDGSPNFSTKTYTDVADKAALKDLIIRLFRGENDMALFYFSGHGFDNGRDTYLVTPDSGRNDEGVSFTELLQIVNNSEARNKIVILDCCFSGAMGSPKLLGTGSFLNKGVTILTACKDQEVAVERNGHGEFTRLLLSALQGGAANIHGIITPGSVYAYIDQALTEWTQRPVFKTNVSRFLPLRIVPSQVSRETLRRIVMYFPSAEYEMPLDPSYEWTNSLDIEHKLIIPYATPVNVNIFEDLQKLQSIGLVVPVNANHMYFAAMESKSCKLTALGRHYWQLVNTGQLK